MRFIPGVRRSSSLCEGSFYDDIRALINQLHIFAFHPDHITKLVHAAGNAERVLHEFPFVGYFLAHADAFDCSIRFVSVGEVRVVAEHFSDESRADLIAAGFCEAWIGRTLRLSNRR